jgi:acyl dehydratase
MFKFGAVTDEGLAQLRARIGEEEPVREPFIRFVNSDSITHAARAIGDDNPLWIDVDHALNSRWGRLMAPPAMLYAVAWGSWDMRRGGLPGVFGENSADRWWFDRPIGDGDEVRATKAFARIDELEPVDGRRRVEEVRELRYFDKDGQLVARQEMTMLRAERDETTRTESVPAASYSAAEIEAIDAEIASQRPRGAIPLYWEDVAPGERLPPLTKGPHGINDIMTWMMGIGSPHVRSGAFWHRYRRDTPSMAVTNPVSGIPESLEAVHWDPRMAANFGVAGPYDQSAQRGAYAMQFLTNWIGDDARLVELDVSYPGLRLIGDVIRFGGEVTQKSQSPATDDWLVECSIEATNQRGEPVLAGTAIVALPTRTADGAPRAGGT